MSQAMDQVTNQAEMLYGHQLSPALRGEALASFVSLHGRTHPIVVAYARTQRQALCTAVPQ